MGSTFLRLERILVFVLLIVLAATTPVYAATTTANSASTLAAAITQASAGDTIELTANITTSANFHIGKSLTIDGKGHTINAVKLDRHFSIGTSSASDPGIIVTLKNLTLINGGPATSGRRGGSVWITLPSASSGVVLKNVKIKNSATAGWGGGIHIQSRGNTVTLDGVEVSGNSASLGGGLYAAGSNVIIKNSAFTNNKGVSNVNGIGTGAGIYAIRDNAYANTLTIENSTFSGNRSPDNGGAFFASANAGTFSLRHVTITGNRASVGGGLYNAGATVLLQNSIIAKNSGGDCHGGLNENVGNFIGDNSCAPEEPATQLSGDPMLAPPRMASPVIIPLFDGSRAIDAGDTTYCLPKDQRGIERPIGENCDIGAYEGSIPMPISAESGSKSDGSKVAAAPAPSTCETIADGILVTWQAGNPQCQRVNAVGIANPLLAVSFVDAVDVWSWVLPNTQVCFSASGGTIKFIDTTVIPRLVHDLPATGLDGMICALIDGPGIVVLLPGPPAPTAVPLIGRRLSGCMVTATHRLSLRDGPGGRAIGYVDLNWTLTALGRTDGWFKVDRFGQKGWVSAEYVTPMGDCG